MLFYILRTRKSFLSMFFSSSDHHKVKEPIKVFEGRALGMVQAERIGNPKPRGIMSRFGTLEEGSSLFSWNVGDEGEDGKT